MASAQSGASWSLTEHLLTANPEAYKAATQSPFLEAAAQGRLSKQILGRWLANDRLYIHGYVRAAGRMLDTVELPKTVPDSADPPRPETELVDWIAETLVALRKEERLFLDVAHRYGLDINLDLEPHVEGGSGRPRVQQSAMSPGLVRFEKLFASVSPGAAVGADGFMESDETNVVLPWLEGAVVLWGTERVYLDAWSWARAQRGGSTDAGEDDDGGAARKEFIPNWSSLEFSAFVDRLGRVLDRAVAEVLAGENAESASRIKDQFAERATAKWTDLLAAETAFWPEMG